MSTLSCDQKQCVTAPLISTDKLCMAFYRNVEEQGHNHIMKRGATERNRGGKQIITVYVCVSVFDWLIYTRTHTQTFMQRKIQKITAMLMPFKKALAQQRIWCLLFLLLGSTHFHFSIQHIYNTLYTIYRGSSFIRL